LRAGQSGRSHCSAGLPDVRQRDQTFASRPVRGEVVVAEENLDEEAGSLEEQLELEPAEVAQPQLGRDSPQRAVVPHLVVQVEQLVNLLGVIGAPPDPLGDLTAACQRADLLEHRLLLRLATAQVPVGQINRQQSVKRKVSPQSRQSLKLLGLLDQQPK
jgi:hypothetical protein